MIISMRGKLVPDTFALLQNGIKSLRGFVLSGNFTIDSALRCASKAAYLAMLLKVDSKNFKHYDLTIDLINVSINNQDFNGLNKIKKTDPEAFFYWYECISLLE